MTCSKSLKEPPGKLSGTVTLTPEPSTGENWAYVEAASRIASYAVTSDPTTRIFSFDNLKVVDLQTMYYLSAHRPGYISYGDSILIEAGVSISNFSIVLQQGLRKDTTFQDGVSPNSSYSGCQDTYISMPDSSTAHGGEPTLIAGGGSPEVLKRALVNFSFNWLQFYPPVDSLQKEIETATLRLYIDSVRTTGSVQLAIFDLNQTFSESLATWINSGYLPWIGESGGSWGVLSSDTVSIGANIGWVEFSIDRIAAQWLLDSQTGPLMLKLVDENRPSTIYFRSADNSSSAFRPILRVAVRYLQ